jgi:dipeptidyl aminopeptidase/acylaminoacyl peptidase
MTRAACWLALACGCALKPATPSNAQAPIAIVASEQGPRGIRLVAIDEHGDRRFELVVPPQTMTQDKNPAVSPDGRWLVFASTRERADGTSLWIAPLAASATPRRLTTSDAIDAHPVWTPDGSAIVFASTRDGGEYNLWRLPIANGTPGEPTQLTTAPGHEVTPTIAPDGTIVYAAVEATAPDNVTSRLEQRAPDGTVTQLTAGPADATPALSPDGATLVFSRPSLHLGKAHSELWLARGTEQATRLVNLPLTDESGPVWSRDGRFVFATSRLAGDESRTTLFTAVVHVDLHEATRRARMLGDRAGPIPRLTPAIVAQRLDAKALHADPEYLPELARIMAAKLDALKSEEKR